MKSFTKRAFRRPSFPNAMAGCALKLCPLSFLQVYILLYKLALLWIRLVSYAKYVLFIFCLSRVNCQDTFDCLKRLRTEVEVRGKQATKAVFSECVLCIQSFLCFCSFFLKTCDPIRRCCDGSSALGDAFGYLSDDGKSPAQRYYRQKFHFWMIDLTAVRCWCFLYPTTLIIIITFFQGWLFFIYSRNFSQAKPFWNWRRGVKGRGFIDYVYIEWIHERNSEL